MRLYLMRHSTAADLAPPDGSAPAGKSSGPRSDPERHLTAKGIQKAREVARGLAALGVEPRVWLSSPYLRALQTAEYVAQVLGHPPDRIRQTTALKPEAPAAELIQMLAGVRAREVIAFGHAPNLDLVIAYALGARAACTALKKAGVACLDVELPAARSRPPAPGFGALVWSLPPRVLRALGKK